MVDFNALTLPDLFGRLTDDAGFVRALDAALREDLDHTGDVTTSSIIDPLLEAEGAIVARAAGVVSGLALVPRLLHRLDEHLVFKPTCKDGDSIDADRALGVVRGPLSRMLMVERTMLNYVGRLSGIATLTSRYVRAVDGTGVAICDTRKTTPGMRKLEKYAVRCGGGTLHRLGLYDAALYKDNHLAYLTEETFADVLVRAIEKARTEHDLWFVEVEVDTLDQFDRVLSVPEGLVDIVLLDNLSEEAMRQAVRRRDEQRPAILLEASGGVDLETVRGVAGTGVDRISVGALTHSAPCLDVGLDVTT